MINIIRAGQDYGDFKKRVISNFEDKVSIKHKMEKIEQTDQTPHDEKKINEEFIKKIILRMSKG